MKKSSQPQLPRQNLVVSSLGALIVRTIKNGLVVSRAGKKLIRDGKQRFESYIITGTGDGEVGLVGVVGIGKKRARFFCDRPRTEVQKTIILAALQSCAQAGAL